MKMKVKKPEGDTLEKLESCPGRSGKKRSPGLTGTMIRLRNAIYWKGKLWWKRRMVIGWNLEKGILLDFQRAYPVFGI